MFLYSIVSANIFSVLDSNSFFNFLLASVLNLVVLFSFVNNTMLLMNIITIKIMLNAFMFIVRHSAIIPSISIMIRGIIMFLSLSSK